MTQSPSHAVTLLETVARRAMVERGLLPDFSPAALTEAGQLSAAAVDRDPGIVDLRALLWASIDNDDSRDLDQLSVAESQQPGGVKLLVAIADVDALVKPGTAIDDHARANTTSVYTASGVFPMLPEKLSTNLTSLGENQERLAIVVEMLVAADGGVTESRLYRAHVRNHAKLAYDSLAAWLDGHAPIPARVAAVAGLEERLRLQDRVAQTMKALRHRHGALSLNTSETRPVFAGEALTDLRTEESNRAKSLIEEFMIAANAATVKYLADKRFPSLRRVLRSPERWARIVELAAGLGEQLPAEASAAALETFLAKQQQLDPQRFPDLSLSVVKLLGRGEYVLEQPEQHAEGHFGLAVSDYTHSTAPNRRFPDLITQRLVKAAQAGRPVPYSIDELRALARHCTEQEDAASKVERQVRKSAAALLLRAHVGELFDAVVTGASAKGTWVRVDRAAAEGRLTRGFEHLDVGDRVRVRLVSTDVERGFIDFTRIEAS